MAAEPKTAFAPAALYRTSVVDPKTGQVTWPWAQHFQLAAQQLAAPVSTAAPTSSSTPVEVSANNVPIASDGDYLYIATGKNQWKRISLTSF